MTRCSHYALAHYALRMVAFEDPVVFLGVLASPDALRFLADLLRQVREHCKDREPLAPFSVEELTVHMRRAGTFPCAVIEMPPPKAITEAHFVAAVLLVDPAEGFSGGEEPRMRYFTLEKGDGRWGPATVLGEWTAEGGHVNFGEGPEPTVEGFLEAIERVVAGD